MTRVQQTGHIARPSGVDLLRRLEAAPPLAIVVPVFNGGRTVAECLQRIVQHAPDDCVILFADDASTDDAVLDALAELELDPRVRVIHNETNCGYTANVNNAILIAAPHDILLLNSDAQPGPLFAQRLRWVAYTRPDVGTVSAISNHAATHSFPSVDAEFRGAWDDVARNFAVDMLVWAEYAAVAHGFCMYLKRALLDDIGSFDAVTFPRGYNEEVDFSFRALAAGWDHVVAPGVMVKHFRSLSFGADTRKDLIASTKPVIDERYPGWRDLVNHWQRSPGWLELKARSARIQRKPTIYAPNFARADKFQGLTAGEVVDVILADHIEALIDDADAPSARRAASALGIPVRSLSGFDGDRE